MKIKKTLEKIVNKEDIIFSIMATGITALGVYIGYRQKEPFLDSFKVETQIEIMKNCLHTYKTALPIGAGVGYVFSKITQIQDYIDSKNNYKKG